MRLHQLNYLFKTVIHKSCIMFQISWYEKVLMGFHWQVFLTSKLHDDWEQSGLCMRPPFSIHCIPTLVCNIHGEVNVDYHYSNLKVFNLLFAHLVLPFESDVTLKPCIICTHKCEIKLMYSNLWWCSKNISWRNSSSCSKNCKRVTFISINLLIFFESVLDTYGSVFSVEPCLLPPDRNASIQPKMCPM